jgi:hypothetical protein
MPRDPAPTGKGGAESGEAGRVMTKTPKPKQPTVQARLDAMAANEIALANLVITHEKRLAVTETAMLGVLGTIANLEKKIGDLMLAAAAAQSDNVVWLHS